MRRSEPPTRIDTFCSLLNLSSPHQDVIYCFDNEDSSPDLDFVIPGLEKPLRLHCDVLSRASATLRALLNGSATSTYCSYDKTAHCVEWTHKRAVSDATYRRVLQKWLRYCYGEDETFNVCECSDAFAVLFQLRIERGEEKEEAEELKDEMERSIVEASRNDVEIGLMMMEYFGE